MSEPILEPKNPSVVKIKKKLETDWVFSVIIHGIFEPKSTIKAVLEIGSNGELKFNWKLHFRGVFEIGCFSFWRFSVGMKKNPFHKRTTTEGSKSALFSVLTYL